MADNIASVYAVQYGTNISLLLQQRGSRFRRAVQVGNYSGKQAEVVTQYGKTEASAGSVCSHGCATFRGHGMFHDNTGLSWHSIDSLDR